MLDENVTSDQVVMVEDIPHGKIAYEFAKAVAIGDFASAENMLVPPLRDELSADDLQDEFTRMIAYGEGPADPDQVQVITDLEDWPDRQNSGLGWAYVAIVGDGFSEGIALVAAEHDRRPGIRWIEWGRP